MAGIDYVPILPAVPSTFTLAELTAELEKSQEFRHIYKLQEPTAQIAIKILKARRFLAPGPYIAKRKNRNI